MGCYEKAIQIDPNYAHVYYNLGNILQELRELQKAKKCYEKLLKLDPTYKKGYSGYGSLLLKITEHSKGLAYIRKIQFEKVYPKTKNMLISSELLKSYNKTKNGVLILGAGNQSDAAFSPKRWS